MVLKKSSCQVLLNIIMPITVIEHVNFNCYNNDVITDQKPRLNDAFHELLPVASDWQNIGTLLEVEPYVLDQIGCDVSRATDRLRVMLSKWRNQCDPSPTWRALADSVEHINPAKAKSMRDRFATQ